MAHLYFVNDIFIKDTTEQKLAPNPVARGLGLDVPGILAVTWLGKQTNKQKTPPIKTCMCQLLVFLHSKIYINAKCFKRYLQEVFFHGLFLLPVEKLHHFLNPRKDKNINPFKTTTPKLTIPQSSDY